MPRVQTPITGITTTSAYEEGSCYSLVNLRPKNGALHPVSPRKIVQELSQKYDIVFVHQNNDYKNWIGVINSENTSSVYWNILNEDPTLIQDEITGKVHGIEQIGNTLSLITSDNIYYLFYQNNNYRFLGELPDLPIINLHSTQIAPSIELTFNKEYGSGTIKPDGFIEATKGLVNKAIDLFVNGGTDSDGNQVEGKGLHFFDAFYIRYAFRLFDGTLTKHSPPILVMPSWNILSLKNIYYQFSGGSLNSGGIIVYGYKVYMAYDLSLFDNWKDIIQSVDIFISQPLGVSSIENIRKDMPTSNSTTTLQFPLIKEITSDALKNVENNSTFYFIRSLELGAKAEGEEDFIPSKDLDISKIDNLIFQELMSDDNFSNHKYGGEVSYTYNNRLHLADIKTTFFKGFSIGYTQWGNNYNQIILTPNPNIADLIVTEVEINTGISVEKVYSQYDPSNEHFKSLYSSAFLSYPDPRAKRITIYEVKDNVWTKVFTTPLRPHNFLNLAYFVNEELKPIISNTTPIISDIPVTTNIITISEPNKIKVSDLNNPLRFPNINVYQAGNGTILAMATNAMNVSDRNFGQYPLYVFTTQGIWTLNVGDGETVYSTQSAPTYTEAPTTPIVCSVPFGVVFTTKRGLMIINGQSVTFISPQIEQTPAKLNIELNNHCEGVVFAPEQNKFADILKNLSHLAYNPYENELLINTKDTLLNYVLNFDNNFFYQSTEKIDLVVQNLFPELLIVKNNQLKDYAFTENPFSHVCFITRPLKYGMPDIKKFERMILRALLYNVTNPAQGKFSLFMVHYSMDGVNFKALTGFPINEGNNKDVDTNLMSRSKFSDALFTLAGVVNEQTEIYYLDTEFEKEYNNTKMR